MYRIELLRLLEADQLELNGSGVASQPRYSKFGSARASL